MVNIHKFKVSKYGDSRLGQTLIETLVAIFILVMGVTASVGLAIFAFNSSTAVTKQIIATGLAREGLESVKNMRDTNWLKDTLSNDCYNYVSGANDAYCYKGWLNATGGYNITAKSIRLNITGASGSGLWSIASASNNWGLDLNSDLNTTNYYGFYGSSDLGSGSADGNSEFYRQIIITEDSSGSYNHNEFHRLIVESRVWWSDKKCPRVQTWPGLGHCSISIQTNLTNWKDY